MILDVFVLQIEAVWLELMYLTRPSLGYVVEQPSGSWGLKQTFIVAVAALLNLNLVWPSPLEFGGLG